MTHTNQGRSRAFTLIELLMVLAILVILAGGVIAKLDVLQLRANKGVAASDMGGISRLMQAYVVANNHYPDDYDSLIDPNGGSPQLWGEGFSGDPATYRGLEPQCVLGPGTTHQKLELFTIPATGSVGAGIVNSLGRMGIAHLQDLDHTDGFPSDGFVGPASTRLIALGTPLAVINSTLNGANFDGTSTPLIAAGDGDADAIMESFYPQSGGLSPDGTFVAVFGLGRSATIVGRSGLLQNAPLYANSGDKSRFYARDLVCFEVSTGGSRARFLGALGADGDRLDEEITEYYEIQ